MMDCAQVNVYWFGKLYCEAKYVLAPALLILTVSEALCIWSEAVCLEHGWLHAMWSVQQYEKSVNRGSQFSLGHTLTIVSYGGARALNGRVL